MVAAFALPHFTVVWGNCVLTQLICINKCLVGGAPRGAKVLSATSLENVRRVCLAERIMEQRASIEHSVAFTCPQGCVLELQRGNGAANRCVCTTVTLESAVFAPQGGASKVHESGYSHLFIFVTVF